MHRDTLAGFFEDLASKTGDFLVYDDGFRTRRYRYQDVGDAARGFAARLHAAGLVKGDAVLFWAENRPEWIAAFWGCVLAGVIVVPVDYRSSLDFARRVGAVVRARVALVGDEVTAAPGTLLRTCSARTSRIFGTDTSTDTRRFLTCATISAGL